MLESLIMHVYIANLLEPKTKSREPPHQERAAVL